MPRSRICSTSWLEAGDVAGDRTRLVDGSELVAHVVIVRGRGVPGGEVPGEGSPVQPCGEASLVPAGAQGALPLGVRVSQVCARDHDALVRSGVEGCVEDVGRPEELLDLRFRGIALGGGRRVLRSGRPVGSRGVGSGCSHCCGCPFGFCRDAVPPSGRQCVAAQRWRWLWARLAPWWAVVLRGFRTDGRALSQLLGGRKRGRPVMGMVLVGVELSEDEGEDGGVLVGEGGGAVGRPRQM